MTQMSLIRPFAVAGMPSIGPPVHYRVRDSINAGDLLIAAVVDLDVFTWLNGRGFVRAAARLGDFTLQVPREKS